jgi:hypothetical protein
MLSLKLRWVQAFLEQVVAIQQHSCSLPAALLAHRGDVRFGADERFNIAPFDRIGPFRAKANVDSTYRHLSTALHPNWPVNQGFAAKESVEGHGKYRTHGAANRCDLPGVGALQNVDVIVSGFIGPCQRHHRSSQGGRRPTVATVRIAEMGGSATLLRNDEIANI